MPLGVVQPSFRSAAPAGAGPIRLVAASLALAATLFAGCAVTNGPIPAPPVQIHRYTDQPVSRRAQPAVVMTGGAVPPGAYEPVALLYAVNETFDSYRRKSRTSFSETAAALGADAVIGFRETCLASPSSVGLAVRRVAPGGTFHLSRSGPLVVAMEDIHWRDHRGNACAVGSNFSTTQRIWAPTALALAKKGFYACVHDAPVGKASRLGLPPGLEPDLLMRVTVESVSTQTGPLVESTDLAVRVDLLDAKSRALVRAGYGRTSLAPTSPAAELATALTVAVLTKGIIPPTLEGYPDSSLAQALGIAIGRAVAQFDEGSIHPRPSGAGPAAH